MSAPVLVVGALRAEVAPLLGRLEGVRTGRADDAGYALGTLGGSEVAVGWTGDGAAAARAGLEALLDAIPATRILVLGLAGGLSPGLEAGDVIVAARVLDELGEAPSPARGWRGKAVGGHHLEPCVFFSSARIVISASEKQDLFTRLETADAAIVDLETATFARIAAARGLAYDAVRIVSDSAREDLPLDFNRMRDGRGRVRQLRVALWAAAHPRAVPALAALGGRLKRGAGTLADVGVSLLASEAA